MNLFRRRAKASSKEEALAEARKATARLRGEKRSLERYRARKQANPADRMTPHQWLGGGGG
ncbi:hypothetical protein GCM10011376_11570 [Nocardioides flavus (ex Wang et al. 2016)]|uniref:Uncharacterized protein n=1 Tax=Nocardioides flavus (ex Wang et al. 2016) TaxID=2058780 RepID=A0ABQ3HJC5_9ACTN|nr:hypothetical protein [Nocardioides flavus (ex Wang et al. 2016)]GHE16547.1 hypothetical protein GCM10011376_11570 [Nocardioides flavus (ex Wang et al. 2016)]